MSRYQETWTFEGNTYIVGESLDEPFDKNNIYPIVWFKGKLYNAVIKPSLRKDKPDKIGLWCIYHKENKPYWTTVDKVFQIIKLNI